MVKSKASPIAAITPGVDRVVRSLRSAVRTRPLDVGAEPRWEPALVADSPLGPDARSMADFGYRDFEVRGSAAQQVALAGPNSLLTEEGVKALRTVGELLETRAVDNDYVVSRRIRNVEVASRFVRDMMRDPGVLRRLSRIAGTILVPHPLRTAATQINYYGCEPGGDAVDARIAKWHHDGMQYVFTMQLNDSAEFEGGRYIYFTGHRDDFAAHRERIVANGELNPDVRRAPFASAGDTIFTRGSRIWHGVTPVTAGRRTTFALSMFCPVDPQDENEFWHTAPDDGLLPTLRSYALLAAARRSPVRYCAREGVDLHAVAAPFPRVTQRTPTAASTIPATEA